MIYVVEVANAIYQKREASVPCPPQGARKSIVMAATPIAQLMRDASDLAHELRTQNGIANEQAADSLDEVLQLLTDNESSVKDMLAIFTEHLEKNEPAEFAKNAEAAGETCKPLQEGYAKRLADILTGLIRLLTEHGEECGDDDGGFVEIWSVDGGGSPRYEPPPPPPAFLGLAPR